MCPITEEVKARKRSHVLDVILLRSVEMMAKRGLYIKTIAANTGLSMGQVAYRIRHVECSVRDYREGKNDEAQSIIRATPCMKLRLKGQKGHRYKVVNIKF